MRVAIIGAGASGLSLYIFLDKLGLTVEHDVTIYERQKNATATEEFSDFNASRIGATMGLSPNGLTVLRKLDADLYEEVLRKGNTISTWQLRAARGWTLANVPASPTGQHMLNIARHDFTECPRRRIPARAVVYKKVVELRIGSKGKPNVLTFDDSSQSEAELVVGADGIWSLVRRAMFTDTGGRGRGDYEFSPHYEGLVGVGGFVPGTYLEGCPTDQMNAVFGSTGFFGYGYCSEMTGSYNDSLCASWWSTYSLKECPGDWRDIDPVDAKRQLRSRHSGWRDVAIQRILSSVEIDSVWPTFVTPLLPTWVKAGCVLTGDAAHALQPSSGQGASMALKDSEALARLLRHHLQKDRERGHLLADQWYNDLRKPRVEMVYRKAEGLGAMKQDMSIVQEITMYFFIWLINRFNLSGYYNARLYEYDGAAEVKRMIRERQC